MSGTYQRIGFCSPQVMSSATVEGAAAHGTDSRCRVLAAMCSYSLPCSALRVVRVEHSVRNSPSQILRKFNGRNVAMEAVKVREGLIVIAHPQFAAPVTQ